MKSPNSSEVLLFLTGRTSLLHFVFKTKCNEYFIQVWGLVRYTVSSWSFFRVHLSRLTYSLLDPFLFRSLSRILIQHTRNIRLLSYNRKRFTLFGCNLVDVYISFTIILTSFSIIISWSFWVKVITYMVGLSCSRFFVVCLMWALTYLDCKVDRRRLMCKKS